MAKKSTNDPGKRIQNPKKVNLPLVHIGVESAIGDSCPDFSVIPGRVKLELGDLVKKGFVAILKKNGEQHIFRTMEEVNAYKA